MNVLDSPLEALAFNYVSFGLSIFADNLWTWVAVVTAAVSYWRIRVAGDDRSSGLSPLVTAPVETTSFSPPPPEKKLPSPIQIQKPSPITSFAEEIEVLTRGSLKFALYYLEDDVTDGDATASEEGEGLTATKELVRSNGDGEEWWGSWEKVLRTMTGESETAGWYRYQDLTELNGNVVRLWDSCHREVRTRADRNVAFCGGPLLKSRNYD